MAKITITIEDGETAGAVSIGVDFDPPAQKGEMPTPAQHAAGIGLQAMLDEAQSEEDEEED